MDLNEAIAKMTLLPAQRLEMFVPNMRFKGRIQVGADADITVFNPETIIDRSTFKEPHQYSEGIRHVFVNGNAVLIEGEMTGARPGQILRKHSVAATL